MMGAYVVNRGRWATGLSNCRVQGEGRTIPLNSALLSVLLEYVEWHKDKFGEARPEWYVFPWASIVPATRRDL
jgi:hypothetical protein